MAKHCDMLATAIYLEWYMKNVMSAVLCNSIKKEWLAHWNDRLGNPTKTPRQVLHSYVEDLEISVAGLDAEMEWDCWEEEDLGSPQDKQQGYNPDQCISPDHICTATLQAAYPPLPDTPIPPSANDLAFDSVEASVLALPLPP
jgi:hypothetical protein